jgi:hypothetical protein
MGEYYMSLAMCLLKTGETERAIEFASKAPKNAKKFGLKRFISFKILYDRALFRLHVQRASQHSREHSRG